MSVWDEPVYRAVVEAMADCVFTLDGEGRIEGIHCPDVRLIPIPECDVVGHSYYEVFPDAVALTFKTAIGTLERTGLPQAMSFVIERDGTRRYFSAKITRPRFSPERECLMVVILDVTGQTLARQASRENELVYRMLEAYSSEVVTVETFAGEYLYASPSVERLVGYRPAEVVGRRRADYMHPEDVQRAREKWGEGELLPSDGEERLRTRVRHKDGRWVWIETDIRRIEWLGRPALLNTTRDITREQLAEERAAAVMGQLEQERVKAERANRAKSEFLASISHDLRTPLHGLLGMAELLEQTHLTQEQQDYLNAIQESGDMLLVRLNDLLDLSKIESGQLELQEVDFDLVEAVEGLVDILGRQAADKGLQLFCHVPPQIPKVVRGDPHRLRQVLINMIGNAIKFTEQGEVDVHVARQDEDVLLFRVRDTGVGMSREQLDMILGRTAPIGPARSRRQPGVGVGLTIAGQLIALMGGDLDAVSAEGEGSTFTFSLRLPASNLADEPAAPGDDALRGRRVLATDENATNRQLIREILEQHGAEVDLTCGGVETIRNLLDDPAYDCVILNAHLPDLDGLSTAAMIRSNRMVEKMPLVMMVSSAEPHEMERCRELAVNATLRKPIRRDVLLRAVRDVLTSGSFEQSEPGDVEGTVLVVEDNDVNLRLARGILRGAGYGVVSARDGREGLRQLEQHRIDAVLMDIQLPDMDGIEATRRIRATPAWAEIPIVAMTAHAMKGDAERFLAAGVDDCLAKPVNREQLLGVLAREIERRHGPGR